MKIFIIFNSSVDSGSILGVYNSKEQAFKDIEFIINEENKHLCNDETFQERWIQFENIWYNQTRHKIKEEVWDEWPTDVDKQWCGNKIYIQEYDTCNLTLQDKVNAINEWQNTSYVHPLTCGNDSSHPNLEPYFDFCWSGIGLRCTHKIDENTWCGWEQKPNHPILDIVYASYS